MKIEPDVPSDRVVPLAEWGASRLTLTFDAWARTISGELTAIVDTAPQQRNRAVYIATLINGYVESTRKAAAEAVRRAAKTTVNIPMNLTVESPAPRRMRRRVTERDACGRAVEVEETSIDEPSTMTGR